ncbi:unnamed protein product [Protopolystoma xenopodis]|uniref:Uncharacterized protein n=1 Tax=Protopolystoma xenopodis TaxID=117903 RepID=A0A448WJ51_9PLAT|nr:unnamed protein product [Protopolystoma xenopodis]
MGLESASALYHPDVASSVFPAGQFQRDSSMAIGFSFGHLLAQVKIRPNNLLHPTSFEPMKDLKRDLNPECANAVYTRNTFAITPTCRELPWVTGQM